MYPRGNRAGDEAAALRERFVDLRRAVAAYDVSRVDGIFAAVGPSAVWEVEARVAGAHRETLVGAALSGFIARVRQRPAEEAAAEEEATAMVLRLLSRGAPVQRRKFCGRPAGRGGRATCARCSRCFVCLATEDDLPRALSALLSSYAPTPAELVPYLERAIACRWHRSAAVLLRFGCRADSCAGARHQVTMLHLAARRGDVDMVKLLLRHGAGRCVHRRCSSQMPPGFTRRHLFTTHWPRPVTPREQAVILGHRDAAEVLRLEEAHWELFRPFVLLSRGRAALRPPADGLVLFADHLARSEPALLETICSFWFWRLPVLLRARRRRAPGRPRGTAGRRPPPLREPPARDGAAADRG